MTRTDTDSRSFASEAEDLTLRAGAPAGRLPQLDGWRAVSILSVLTAHMLPLGPSRWNLNGYLAALGMTIFFNLSGFLIVSILLRDSDVRRFLIRRVVRIVPLAWLVLFVLFSIYRPSLTVAVANLLFYVNLPPFLMLHNGHFWSLCVEMQFYAGIAVLVGIFGKRVLLAVPLLCIGVTLLRIAAATTVSIVTWLRLDEILAGGIVVLMIHYVGRQRIAHATRYVPIVVVVLMYPLTVVDELPALCYLRPYICALMIGLTLVRDLPRLNALLSTAAFRYIARISYALYIIHPYTREGWLIEGSSTVKAVKRLVSLGITFFTAHVSTLYFEKPLNDWAHRITIRSVSRG